MAQETEILKVIEKVNLAALDGERWPSALTALADLLGGVDSTLEVHLEVGDRPSFFAAGNRLPLSGIEDYLNHYAAVCPRIPFLANLATGSVCHDYDFISEPQMDRNEFYADFLAADDLRYFTAAKLGNQPGMMCGVYVHYTASQASVSKSGLALLKQLLPHVDQALKLHFHMKKQAAHEAHFRDLVDCLPQAIVTLTDCGEILFANEAALKILRTRDGLELCDGQLRIADAEGNSQMGAIIKSLLRNELDCDLSSNTQVVVRRCSGHRPFVLDIHRLGALSTIYEDSIIPALAVFIYDPDKVEHPHAPLLAQVFSLTRREADLAVAILQGLTVREHAEARGVGISTERSHLKSLMRKTDTHSQTELVRLLSRLNTPN